MEHESPATRLTLAPVELRARRTVEILTRGCFHMIRCRYCRNRVYFLEAECCYCHRRRMSRTVEKVLVAAFVTAQIVGFGFLLLRIASS